ncbi:MAG: hypothetical protein HS126_19015 [Anaerolineales bacterium]|nr:hypothetical protein [Anaerolineales bacterium]
MSHNDKLLHIDRVLGTEVNNQIKEMVEQLRALQAQTRQLEKQYGKARPAQAPR